jgi:hypothetical protein
MAPREVGPHPPPGADFHTLALPITVVGGPLVRIHRLNRHPAFWGRTGDNRFDAPAAEFGVLYAAADHHGAFIETCSTGVSRAVSQAFLAARGWSEVHPLGDLRLVDLSGPGLAALGADARLCTGDHAVSQLWALAIWQHPEHVDGLLYRCRHDPSRMAAALFDRAAPHVTVVPTGGLLDADHADILMQVLDTYQFALMP